MYPFFRSENKAKSKSVSCLGSQSSKVVEPRLKPTSPDCREILLI